MKVSKDDDDQEVFDNFEEALKIKDEKGITVVEFTINGKKYYMPIVL